MEVLKNNVRAYGKYSIYPSQNGSNLLGVEGVDKHSSRMVCCVGDGHDDGLVVVLFCRGDSFEEDLRCGPKLEVFVDLVELDEVDGADVPLFKIVEPLRGAFFFSTSVELKTKSTGGGGAYCEIMDSNTSLPRY